MPFVLFAGHGDFDPAVKPPRIPLPDNTTLYMFTSGTKVMMSTDADKMVKMSESDLEKMKEQAIEVIRPGESVDNLRLTPDGYSEMLDHDPSVTVVTTKIEDGVLLAQLLTENAGKDLFWCCCRATKLRSTGGAALGVNVAEHVDLGSLKEVDRYSLDEGSKKTWARDPCESTCPEPDCEEKCVHPLSHAGRYDHQCRNHHMWAFAGSGMTSMQCVAECPKCAADDSLDDKVHCRWYMGHVQKRTYQHECERCAHKWAVGEEEGGEYRDIANMYDAMADKGAPKMGDKPKITPLPEAEREQKSHVLAALLASAKD